VIPFYTKDGAFSAPDQPLYYLLTRDGLFLVRRSPFFTTELKVAGLPWLAGHEEQARLHLPRPIPQDLFDQAVSFFQAVFARYGSEAILLLYYLAAEDGYRLVAPRQEVSRLTCHYEIEPTPAGWTRLGSLHSHGALEAGHSDIDARDERYEDGLHFTVGNLRGTPALSSELVVDGRRFEVPAAEVLEPFQPAEFPREWLQAVSGNPLA
jgi:hypothetical protein